MLGDRGCTRAGTSLPLALALALGRPGPVDGAVAWCARAGLECLERDQMTDRQQNELICCVLFKVETDTCLY